MRGRNKLMDTTWYEDAFLNDEMRVNTAGVRPKRGTNWGSRTARDGDLFLRYLGFYRSRQNGSHITYNHQETGASTVLVCHIGMGEPLTMTFKETITKAGVTVEQWIFYDKNVKRLWKLKKKFDLLRLEGIISSKEKYPYPFDKASMIDLKERLDRIQVDDPLIDANEDSEGMTADKDGVYEIRALTQNTPFDEELAQVVIEDTGMPMEKVKAEWGVSLSAPVPSVLAR